MKRFSKKTSRFAVRLLAAIITLTVILSTVSILGPISFADDNEQMFSIISDVENQSESNVIIPIMNPNSLSGNLYFKLTFEANMVMGEKPIVGVLKVNSQSSKRRVNAYPNYVDNESEKGTDTSTAPSLYTTYDAKTMKYTAIMMLNLATKISGTNSSHDGIAAFLTVGNTEASKGDEIGTSDKSLEFVFAKPVLKQITYNSGVWEETGDNLLSPSSIKASNVDFSKEYVYNTTNYSTSEIKSGVVVDNKIPVVMAPVNTVSTFNKSLVSALDYNEKLSLGHNYTYHEELEPTTTAMGTKAYYTCDCGDCDGKRFFSKNQESEILNFGELEIPVATEKMIVVRKNSTVSNVVVPVPLNDAVKDIEKTNAGVITGGNNTYDVYAKLKFKARMFSGTKPIIGVLGKSGKNAVSLKDNADNENAADTSVAGVSPDLYCNYNPATLEYEAVVKINLPKDSTGNDFAITVGNAEHDGDGFDSTDYEASFAVTDPELYILKASDGSVLSENLLNPINSYNTKFTDEKDGDIIFDKVSALLGASKFDYSRDGADNTVIKADIPGTFFAPTHTFVYEPEVFASKDVAGKKAYYHATCSEKDCCFKDKLYLDMGYTETTEAELNTGKWEKITIGAGHNTNVFVPLDLSGYVKTKHLVDGGTTYGGSFFVKLSFKAQMIEGEKPVVSRIRGSTDQGGQYSFSEPDYSDNINETPAPAGQPPVLYSKLNKETNEYEAVLRLSMDSRYSVLENGIHDAILIGNSNHNGNGYKSESDPEISFSFCEPELYLLDATTGEVDKSTGNLLPDICERNIAFDKLYKHNANPCKETNHILSAPKNMWSIDSNGSLSDVSASEYTDKDFKVYKWTFHKQVSPTVKKNGHKSYYTCDCGDPSCDYAGKMYSDKGVTEVTDDDIILTYSKMIKVGGGTNNNVFIPLDIKKYLKNKYKSGNYSYVQLSFTARMISGEKPIISRVRGNHNGGDGSYSEPDYVDNNDTVYSGIENTDDNKGPDLYCKYDEETGKFTAIIKVGIGIEWATMANGISDVILIGNAEHNGKGYSSESNSNTSFYFCDPELYFVDATTGIADESTGNLIAPITAETLNFNKEYVHDDNPCTKSNNLTTAPANMWSIDGSKDNFAAESIPDGFFGAYKFVYVKAENPTPTKKGVKAHYICDCGDPSCQYNGKYFSDKGFTEITDIEYGYAKMITVSKDNASNVFVPLNIANVATSKHITGSGYVFVKVRFKTRMLNGTKPIVARMRGSSDQDAGKDYTWSEPDYADNEDDTYNGVINNSSIGVTGPDMYSHFDEDTNIFEAVLCLRVNQWWSTNSNGAHDAVMIGHQDYNGGVAKHADNTVAFSISEPELYLLDVKTGAEDTSVGNLFPPICDETFNAGKTYEHNGNPCKLTNNIMTAPINMWSINGSTEQVKLEEITDGYFNVYKWVFHPQVNPTANKNGTKAYYTCECGDPSCMYKGKYYSDKGFTEITDITLSKTKMITVGGGANNNVAIPLNIKEYLKDEYKDFSKENPNYKGSYSYVMLTFTARMIDGEKPIVSRIRGNHSGGDGAYSEPDYADNNDNVYDGIEVKSTYYKKDGSGNETEEVDYCTYGPDLYTKYDPQTLKFTAIIKVGIGIDWATMSNGVSDILLIGNAEHNGNGYSSETDSSVSFSFCDPELYFVNAQTGVADTSTGNLITPICDETVNFGEEYLHDSNPCMKKNNLTNAPKDMWSIDGSKSNITCLEIPDKYFRYYNFVFHKQKSPTSTEKGLKAHYTCDCGDPSCMYDGKYYSDKGITEVTYESLVLGTTKMIKVGSNAAGQSVVSNVFVPLNLKPYVKDKHKTGEGIAVKLTFKAKMLSGSYPIISRIRGSSDKVDEDGKQILGSWSEPGYADNNDHSYDGIINNTPDYYTEYDEDTNTFTAIIGLRVGASWSTLTNGLHDAILIGNAEHNGPGFKVTDYNTSFIFADPELYLIDMTTGDVDKSTGNLIAPICDETLNFGKTYGHTTDNPCYVKNHIMSAPKDEWSIDGSNKLVSIYDIPEGYFDAGSERATAIKITNGASNSIFSTTANLKPDTNYKIDIDYSVSGGGKLNVDYKLLDATNKYVSLDDMGITVETPIDNVKNKHYSAVISAPSAAALGTETDNFKLIIGANGGTVKVANVKVRPVSITGVYGYNVLANGDFRCAPAGKDYDNIYKFWNIENKTEIKKTEAVKIGKNEFADTTPVAAFVSETTGKLTTKVSLKPNTNYEFRFASKYSTNAAAKPAVKLYTDSGNKSKIGSFKNDTDGQYNTVYTFKTPADMKSGVNAEVGVNIDSAEISGAFSGFELYEVSSTGSRKGDNLIKDAYLLDNGTPDFIFDETSGLNAEYKPVSIYYFKKLPPKVLVFSGRNGYDRKVDSETGKMIYAGNYNSYFEHTANIVKGKQYIFSVNYKFAREGYLLKEGQKNGPQVLVNTANGFVEVDAKVIESKKEYKTTYIFTAPDNISEGKNNFKFKFNIIGSGSAGYMSNASLHEYNGENAVGEELIENGNFSTGDASQWNISGKSDFYMTYYVDIPDGFFSKTNPTKPHMIIYRDAEDYAQYMQHFFLKPNTSYEIEYKGMLTSAKFEDKLPYISLYRSAAMRQDNGEYIMNESGNVSSSTTAVPSSDIYYKSKDGKKMRFKLDDDLTTTGDGNFIVFLVTRNGCTGIWGEVTLYELDSKGKKIGNNLILNGDFSLGTTAWTLERGLTARVVEQPDGFFESDFGSEPEKMIYSNGTKNNQLYGNTFKLKKGQSYYFSGNYVNMNAQGITPEITYTDESGEKRVLSTDLYYDADRYYFEIKFTVPDDAKFTDGLTNIGVYMNNKEGGKGYFHSLMLTEAEKFVNLFDEKGFKYDKGNYEEMKYDPEVFVFYSDDSAFDDGDWSGEEAITDSDAKGVVLDPESNGVKGIKMLLKLNKKTVKTAKTDKDGSYSFKGLKPGKYSLYLVSPVTGKEYFCISFDVEECKSITLPKIIYTRINGTEPKEGDTTVNTRTETTTETVVVPGTRTETVEVEGDVVSVPRSILQCLLFDENGKRMSNIPIFVENNGYAITNEKGIATFNYIRSFGEKRVYINLDNGQKYIFRTVKLEADKGTRIKLMYQSASDNTLLYILLIIGGALLVVAAGTFVTILLVSKKKKKAAAQQTAVE